MSNYSNLSSYAVSLAINLTVVGAFFAVGIALSFRLARQLSPRVRYIITVIAFFAAAALPIDSTLRASQEQAAALQAAAAIERGQRSSTAIPLFNHESRDSINSFDEADMSNEASRSTNESRPEALNRIVFFLNAFVRASAESWPGVGFIALWAFVAVLLIAREVLGYVHLARARHNWHIANAKIVDYLLWPGSYPLFISEHEGPCTVGLVQPAVVMPSDLLDDISMDAARLITRHELAHAQWRDPLMNAVLRIIRALLWPSLPLWYLGRVAGREREAASDLSAVAGCPHEEIKSTVLEYATLLVVVAGRSGKKRRHWKYELTATEAGNRVDLESRVVRLLKLSSKPTRARVLLAAFALIAAVWGAIFLPVAAKPIMAPNSSISDVVVIEESKTAPNTKEATEPDKVALNVFLAAQDENSRTSNGEHSIKNASEQRIMESAQQLQPGNNQNNVGPTLSPQTNPDSRGDISQDFVNEMASLGYKNLSPDQLAAMKTYGVSSAYVGEMAASGYNNLTADALINFRWLDVSPTYVGDMNRLGYKDLSANTIIDFRLYGVTPSYIKEMAAAGFAKLPAKTLVNFRRLGINSEYVRELKSQGHEALTPDRLIDIRTQKVAAVESNKRSNAQNE